MKKFLFIAFLCAAVFTSCEKDKSNDGKILVESITMEQTASVDVGEKITLTATAAPENAENKKLVWDSSDKSVATVMQSGVVSGLKAGTTTISVTTEDGSKSTSCTVTVVQNGVPPTGVTLNRAVLNFMPGESSELIATVAPENATNKNITWTSSDLAVATVSDAGLVTAVKVGTATITAKTERSGKIATCDVNVTATMSAMTPGDFYYDDNTYSKVLNKSKNCVGIVFWVSFADIRLGKIVSLDEAELPFVAQGVVSTIESTSDMEGIKNKQAILSLPEYSAANYPALAYCMAKGDAYYLAAAKELEALFFAKAAVENSFRDVKAANPILGTEFLTSTVSASGGVVSAMKLISGATQGTSIAGTTACNVRAVRVIEIL